jgi:hypothetical protein
MTATLRYFFATFPRNLDELMKRRAAMRNKFLLMFLLMAMSGQAAAWDDSLTADSTFSIIARDVAAGERWGVAAWPLAARAEIAVAHEAAGFANSRRV